MNQVLRVNQKNQLFQAIEKMNHNPSDFKYDTKYNVVDVLYVHDTDMHFRICNMDTGFRVELSPDRYIVYSQYLFRDHEFSEVVDLFSQWLVLVGIETKTPDLWTEFEKNKSDFSLAVPDDISNEKISYVEAELIIESLHTFEAKILDEFKLAAEERSFISSRIEYLIESAKRSNRFDWINMAIGVINLIPVVLKFNPEQVALLFSLAQETLGRLPYFLPS